MLQKKQSIWKKYKEHFLTAIASISVAFLLSKFKLLSVITCLPIWALCLVAFFPFAIYLSAKWLYLASTRKYKLLDEVQIVGDKTKFVVYTYEFWYPKHAICKEHNSTAVISVHEKYLKKYEPKQDLSIPTPWEQKIYDIKELPITRIKRL